MFTNTVSKMVTIPHWCFLDIIDEIFDAAPPASLAVMAKTCHEWRELALSKFYHVHDLRIEATEDSFVARLWAPIGRPEPLYYDGLVLTGTELSLLAGCKILDITEDPSHRSIQHLPNLDTVRCHFDVGTHHSIPARQIVCEGHIYPIETANPTVKRLVVYSGGHNDYFYSNTYPALDGLTSLEEMVLLFEDVPSCMEDFDYTRAEVAYYLDDDMEPELECPLWLLSTMEDVIFAGRDQGAQVLLVGTEQWTAQAFDALKGRLERMFDDDEPISFVTVKEYRAQVGEKEWAIETDFEATFTAEPRVLVR